MSTIRSEQVEVFQPGADEAFVRRVAGYLRTKHAGQVVRLPEGSFTVSSTQTT